MLPATVQFFIALFACAINERQQKALDYKSGEVLILKEVVKKLTKKERIDFTEDQRRRLAVLGKDLTPKQRREYCEIVKPKTQMSVETRRVVGLLLPRGGLSTVRD